MKGLEEAATWHDQEVVHTQKEIQLIDLFVDMCFYDIHNPIVIYQFKDVGLKLNYSLAEVDKVVEIGLREYHKITTEINSQLK